MIQTICFSDTTLHFFKRTLALSLELCQTSICQIASRMSINKLFRTSADTFCFSEPEIM